MHAKRLDKTPAASVCGDPGVGKTVLLDHLTAGGSSLTNGGLIPVVGRWPDGGAKLLGAGT